MKTKKAKLLNVVSIREKVVEKKLVSDDELNRLLQNSSGYEGKLKIYRDYWISDDFIEANKNWIHWDFLCTYQPLSAKMIEKYHLNIDFDRLITYQRISQKLLLKFYEQINVDTLTQHHPLSEKFIEKYHDKLCMCWSNVVYHQDLSLDFLIKHKDKFELEDLDGGFIDEDTVDNFKIFMKMGVI
jgi:hypothetical protein